jgi:hypothetical protein
MSDEPVYNSLLSENGGYVYINKDDGTRFQLHSEKGLSKANTNSPEFKKWFNGSVMTNKDGSPKVLYRGINTHYDPQYKKEEGGTTWVTDSLEHAEQYRDTYLEEDEYNGKPIVTRYIGEKGRNKETGDLLEAYVSVKKPFDLGIVNDIKSPHDFYIEISKQLQKDVTDGKITSQQMK